jgi:hypothetical protein
MDKIFTQQELFWLDDILPGTKIGRIRRLSAPRNVHIPKLDDEYNDKPATVNKFSYFFFALTKKENQSFSATT